MCGGGNAPEARIENGVDELDQEPLGLDPEVMRGPGTHVTGPRDVHVVEPAIPYVLLQLQRYGLRVAFEETVHDREQVPVLRHAEVADVRVLDGADAGHIAGDEVGRGDRMGDRTCRLVVLEGVDDGERGGLLDD